MDKIDWTMLSGKPSQDRLHQATFGLREPRPSLTSAAFKSLGEQLKKDSAPLQDMFDRIKASEFGTGERISEQLKKITDAKPFSELGQVKDTFKLLDSDVYEQRFSGFSANLLTPSISEKLAEIGKGINSIPLGRSSIEAKLDYAEEASEKLVESLSDLQELQIVDEAKIELTRIESHQQLSEIVAVLEQTYQDVNRNHELNLMLSEERQAWHEEQSEVTIQNMETANKVLRQDNMFLKVLAILGLFISLFALAISLQAKEISHADAIKAFQQAERLSKLTGG